VLVCIAQTNKDSGQYHADFVGHVFRLLLPLKSQERNMSDKEPCGTTVPECVSFDHLRDNEAYASEQRDYPRVRGGFWRSRIGIWRANHRI